MPFLIKNILNSRYGAGMINLVTIKRNCSIGFEVLSVEHHWCSRQTEANVTYSENFQMKLEMLIYKTGQNFCELPTLKKHPF